MILRHGQSRFVLLLICCLMLWHSSNAQTPKEHIVLLHGMGRSAWSMKRLEWTFRKLGYEVTNLDYPSQKLPIEKLTEKHLYPLFTQLQSQQPTRIHVVTHSLGGILLRHYLTTHTITNLGNVVMLAPPNQGSELADRLQRFALARRFVGPCLSQLGIDTKSIPLKLGAVEFSLGVIAGTRTLNPLFSATLTGRDDGKVSVASTRVAGMRDHLEVPSSHTWLMWRKSIIAQTVHYIRHGSFQRAQ